jgi:hypothetical protein
VIATEQVEVIDRGWRPRKRHVRDRGLAGDLRYGALDPPTVEEHEHAGEVVRVVEHLHGATTQRGVDDEPHAADLDGRGLGVNCPLCGQPE